MKIRRDVFQAIADPTRREILNLLLHGSQNVNGLAEKFAISRQAVSLHVKVLKECEVVSIRKAGRERFCELKATKLAEVADWLQPFRQLWEARFNELDKLLEEVKKQQDE